MFIDTSEMSKCILVLFAILLGYFRQFFVSFDLYNQHEITSFHKEVRAKFAALCMFPFLPGVFNLVKAGSSRFDPGIIARKVFGLQQVPNKTSLWVRISYRYI